MIRSTFKTIFALIWAAITFTIYQLAFKAPGLVEAIYSNGIYVFFTKTIGRVANALSVSLAEILVYILALSIIFLIIYIICAFFKPRGEKLTNIFKRVMSLVSLACTLYSIFIIFWGFNYARKPLSETMNLDTSSGYSYSELKELTIDLIDTCNTLRASLGEDEKGVFKTTMDKKDILDSIGTVYKQYAPSFANTAPETRVKGVFTKNALSITKTLGIFSPFTLEPNVNMEMPDLYFASTAAHEYAHLEGFAREDEADFLSWYVLSKCNNKEFRYSAYMSALSHALNACYKADKDGYADIYNRMNDGLKRDFINDRDYWKQFDGKIAETSDKIYTQYLQSNKIDDGLKSYGRMLDLMLALRKTTI